MRPRHRDVPPAALPEASFAPKETSGTLFMPLVGVLPTSQLFGPVKRLHDDSTSILVVVAHLIR